MNKTVSPPGLFGSKRSSAEAKADATTRAAREIDAAEKAAVDAKTARLRALRLAKEEADAAAAAANPPPPKPTRRRATTAR